MGENFYHSARACPTCGHRPEGKHIGKSSHGWSFLFQGYWDITSYQDWKKEFENPKKQIVNESGDALTIQEFDKIVQSKKDGLNHARIYRNEAKTDKEKEYIKDLQKNIYYDWYDPRHAKECWVDKEGHSFSSRDFR